MNRLMVMPNEACKAEAIDGNVVLSCGEGNHDGLRGLEPLTISVPHRRSERDAAPLFGGPVRGVVNANGFISEVQTGQRLAAEGDAFLEILDFLDIAAGPLLLEADELPAGLRSTFW